MPPDKIAVANCRPESKSLFAGSPKSETTRGNKIAGAFIAGAFVAGAFGGEPRRPRDMQPPRKSCAAKTVTTGRRFAAANNTNA
jgi:hypothetical protein